MNWKLKQKIIEKFGSQWKFAQALGVHESIVSFVVRGHREVTSEDQGVWAAILECLPEEIFPSAQESSQEVVR